ncbi:MAG: 2-dehydro-3-deoxygalactonokinase [Acetobacteraceae bacterium]
MSATPRLIGLDWGTTALRSFLLGDDGAILDSRALPLGIMHVSEGGFPAAFDRAAGDWRRQWPHLQAIAAGMVGSAQGWVPAPYRTCPTGPDELAAGLARTPDGALHIIPGVMQAGDAPDVMRGEETQIAGALALMPALQRSARLVMPGTHSKWVRIAEGRIQGFTTYMTGELFAVLAGHSILGRPAAEAAAGAGRATNWDAFSRGVAAVQATPRGLAPLLFSTRSLVLTGQLPAADSLDYLSGLLIGEELRSALDEGDRPVLIGEPALCQRYRHAFTQFGLPDLDVVANGAAAGLWRVALQAGLVAMEETRQ